MARSSSRRSCAYRSCAAWSRQAPSRAGPASSRWRRRRRMAEPGLGIRARRFAAAGVAVMIASALLLVALVELAGMNPHLAYVVQAVFAIETSFVLSRWWTWRERRADQFRGIAGEWLRF